MSRFQIFILGSVLPSAFVFPAGCNAVPIVDSLLGQVLKPDHKPADAGPPANIPLDFGKVAQIPLPGASIPKFVDPVPTFSGSRVDGRQPVTVSMQEFQQRVLPDCIYASLTAPYTNGTYVWGYQVNDREPRWPGWTIEARRNETTVVSYFNQLQGPKGEEPVLQKYFSVDQTLHWADPLYTTMQDECTNGPPYKPNCLRRYAGPWPLTVHLHGGEDQSTFDGQPDTWFTPDFGLVGSGFITNAYVYPNKQEATTLWYHDHAVGITRLDVFGGLAGTYLLRDERDTGLPDNPIGLPAGPYEQELMLQDRQFDTNGQLLFPDGFPAGLNGPPGNPNVHPYWIPEFIGDVMTVNGKSWPFLEVEPRRYRFRLVNGSNSRFMALALVDADTRMQGPSFWQIGTDGGLLDTPAKLNDPQDANAPGLLLGPAERADIIVDFSAQAGHTFTLANTAPIPFPDGTPPDPATDAQVMQFRVSLPLQGTDTTYNPQAPRSTLRAAPIVRLDPTLSGKPADLKRQLILVENESAESDEPLEVLLNNSKWAGMREGSDPETPILGSVPNRQQEFTTELPRVGATELWEVANLTDDAHPIHIHLIQFQLINRQSLDRDAYRSAWDASFPGATVRQTTYAPGVYIPGFGPPLPYTTISTAGAVGGNPDFTPFLNGPVEPPPGNESGWKDTIRMMPASVTRIVARWAPQDTAIDGVGPGQNLYPFDPTVGPGYVWHCHIFDHEDNEMMRPYTVQR